MDSRIPTDHLDVRASLPKKYKKSRIGEPATFVLLALLTAAICVLSWPGAAQDGPRPGDENRTMWRFTVWCYPSETIDTLMWRRWSMVEWGWGFAVPPDAADTAAIEGAVAPKARLWISEDGEEFAWTYKMTDGRECIIDHGTQFRLKDLGSAFGEPT